MSPEAWSAAVAAVGVIAAIVFQIVEWRRQRFSRGIDTIAQMDARWDGSEFREIRRLAANHLLGRRTGKDPAGEEATRTVLNFFETLGFFQRKRVADPEAIWHFFASWLLPYYHAGKPVRDQSRKHDPSCYSDFEALYLKTCELEKKRHPTSDTLHVIGEEAIRDFLECEAKLELGTVPSTTPG